MVDRIRLNFTSCQWPFGDPQQKGFHFCGEKNEPGKPYCQKHCDVAYVSDSEIKKRKTQNKRKFKRQFNWGQGTYG